MLCSRRVAAAVAAAFVVSLLTASGSAGAGTVTVTQAVTNQWTSGYEAALTIRNDTGAVLRSWRLEFDLPHRISSLWDGVVVGQMGDHVVVDAPSWQGDLPAEAPPASVTWRA